MKPTARDDCWHAALCTAATADVFGLSDVENTADEIGVDVANRTVRKVLYSMEDFGYLEKVDRGRWRLKPEVADAFGTKSARLDRVIET